MKRFKWDDKKEHLEFLRTGYLSMNVRDLTMAFNKKFKLDKTEISIKSAIENRKIRCGRKPKDRIRGLSGLYTIEQVQFLKTNYQGRSLLEMWELFNTTFKTDFTLGQIKSALDNRGITSGLTGQFKKGSVPANKGTKGLTGRNKTSFKKGHVPKNLKDIGSERICSKDGYVLIKVDMINPHTGYRGHWLHKHVVDWEQVNGPVPKGMVLAFRDGDKLNIENHNLMLISRSLLCRLNKLRYKEAPAELKPSILLLARLVVKTAERRSKCNQRLKVQSSAIHRRKRKLKQSLRWLFLL